MVLTIRSPRRTLCAAGRRGADRHTGVFATVAANSLVSDLSAVRTDTPRGVGSGR
jgi:hypothetical protein